MKIITLGVTHKTAPIELREQLAVSRRDPDESLDALCHHPNVSECVVLSTCNRVELYAAVMPPAPLSFLKTGMAGPDAAGRPEMEACWMALEQPESVRHLFEVVSGLDAMVVGEQEIVAQVKEAFRRAEQAKTIGPVLGALFRKALSVSKRVRTETRIGQGGSSVASVAVQLARKVFGELQAKRVMIIGAGETAELTLRHLAKSGARSVVAVNRSFDPAERLAKRFRGRAAPFEERLEELVEADIVVTATASPEPVLTAEELRGVMARRPGRPICLMDIAVPRDVEPGADQLEGVHLFNIDDLRAIAEEHRRTTTLELDRCRAIVEEETNAYERWLRRHEIEPTIKRLYDTFETVRARELDDHLRRFRGLTPELRRQIEQLSKHLVKELLHGPVSRLRGLADPGALARHTKAHDELFAANGDDRDEEDKGE